VPNDVKEYPTVGHAFLNALPPAFKGKYNPLAAATAVNFRDPAAVEDAWRRIFAFFDGHVRRNNTSD
jgi:carboxymethylenebutenolidase